MKIVDLFELERFASSEPPKKQLSRLSRILATTLFLFFAPLVLVGNMWVFYALYRGIGFAITVGASTVLLAGIIGYVDTKVSSQPHSRPTVLAWSYLAISLLIHLSIVALL